VDLHPSNDTVDHLIHVGALTDYAVALTDTADPVAPGAPYSYVAHLVNQGADDTQGANLQFTLPAQVSYVSSNPPGCTGGTPVVCPIGALPSGGSTDVTLNVVAGTFTEVSTSVLAVNYGEQELSNNVAVETTKGALLIRRELNHGSALTEPLPAGTPAERVYYLSQAPHASYEVVVDATSGDVAAPGQTIALQRLDAGLATVQTAVAAGAGASRALRFENASDETVEAEVVRVQGTGCTSACGPGDTYRVRAFETTASIARFNTEASQTTGLLLDNLSDATVSGHAWLSDEPGNLVGSVPFSLGPRQSLRVDLATVAPGRKGVITISHDGGYGALAGKGVAVEPATGLTFDTPLVYRPR
jgi:hypothetical protein